MHISRPKTTKRFDDDLAAFERDEELCNNQQSVTPQIKVKTVVELPSSSEN